jgi:hypothetical protein
MGFADAGRANNILLIHTLLKSQFIIGFIRDMVPASQ